ncbi:MAG TPA: transketolase [Hanamia sp.]
MHDQTLTGTTTAIEQLSIETLRFLSIDMVQKANSGHPGLPLDAAPMAYVLWTRFLKYNPKDPNWLNRDRFILSPGHGCALLYSLLHLTGYDLSMDDLKRFRQMDSKTPGHPESLLVPGVEVTTGPLGQGFGNSVGVSISEAFLAATYNRPDQEIFDYYTYMIASDGDLMEGISSEAASLGGHLQLGKLICLYDDNHVSLDGPTSLAFTEDRLKRFEAYGWHTQQVDNGNDLDEIESAIKNAQQHKDKPSIIAVRTILGYGSPVQNTSKAHGSPLGAENIVKTKEFFGADPHEFFFVPDGVYEHMQTKGIEGSRLEDQWKYQREEYTKLYSKEAVEIKLIETCKLPEKWDAKLPIIQVSEGPLATRQASGTALKILKESITFLIGGSADLASSTETPTKHELSFQPGRYEASNIWFGVREHGMGAILNGMIAKIGIKAYGGTFLAFSDYMRGAIRLAALSEEPVIYIFTHDSIGMGEDGPTHQPIGQIAALRAMPNLVVIRPGDANETIEAWRVAISSKKSPVALILCRQKIPVIDQQKFTSARNLEKGAYIISEASGDANLILVATGSELQLALGAQEELEIQGIHARVVSMPSFELFERQTAAYKEKIFPANLQKRISIEAGTSFGWQAYIGREGRIISIDSFGRSAPGQEVMEKFGFTVENVVNIAKSILKAI